MKRTETTERADTYKKLPIRAIVAVAVRTCQRQRASFDLPGNNPERGIHMAAVSNAIQIAKRFVEGDDSFGEETRVTVNSALSAAGEAPGSMLGIPATHAGFTAGLVFDALHGNKELIPIRAAHVIPATQFSWGPEAEADYQKLLALNLGTFPELGPPIDLSEKGPLGPL